MNIVDVQQIVLRMISSASKDVLQSINYYYLRQYFEFTHQLDTLCTLNIGHWTGRHYLLCLIFNVEQFISSIKRHNLFWCHRNSCAVIYISCVFVFHLCVICSLYRASISKRKMERNENAGREHINHWIIGYRFTLTRFVHERNKKKKKKKTGYENKNWQFLRWLANGLIVKHEKIIDQNRSTTIDWFNENTRFSCAFFFFIQIMFISSFCICWSFGNTTQDHKQRIYNEYIRNDRWSTQQFLFDIVEFIIMFQCSLSLCTHNSKGFLWKRKRNEKCRIARTAYWTWSLITGQVISFGMSVFLFGMQTVQHGLRLTILNVKCERCKCVVQSAGEKCFMFKVVNACAKQSFNVQCIHV